jgi:hypothetical protein
LADKLVVSMVELWAVSMAVLMVVMWAVSMVEL